MILGFVSSTAKRIGTYFVLLVTLFFATGYSRSAAATPKVDLTGDWNGTLNTPSVSLHLALHVTSDASGKLRVTLDSLDQGSGALPATDVALSGNSFSFAIPSVSGSYSGTVGADGSTIEGTWNQNASLPLKFTREHSSASTHKLLELVGEWYGVALFEGTPLRMALHISTDAGGSLRLTFDDIDQKNLGLPASDVALKGENFSFKIAPLYATYRGTLDDNSNTISGTWSEDIPIRIDFKRYTGGPTPTAIPTPEPAPARAPVALDDLKPVLDREMAPVLEHGLLSKSSAGGVVIGVLQHGKRQVFAYGTARPDSIFEIGSITKTFTGLILAQMVMQKKVTLEEPIRELLPNGFVAKPSGAEITLVDLATQHSGLPRMPDNYAPRDPDDPYADYDASHLQEFIGRYGVAKPDKTYFHYSNLGFGLLGFGLSERAGASYSQLLADEVLAPLRMSDTGVALSLLHKLRLIQGHNGRFDPVAAWDFGALAGCGAIKSTAADMLTYLDANLHPEKYSTGTAPGSPAGTMPAAMALDHQVRANISPSGDRKIALAWWFDPDTGVYSHPGGTAGYMSMAGFNPEQDLAVVTLYNRDNLDFTVPRFAERLNQNIFEVMTGKPAIQIDYLSDQERSLLNPPRFPNAYNNDDYHDTATAFSSPAGTRDRFIPVASADSRTRRGKL